MTGAMQRSRSPWMALARLFYFFVTPVLVVGGGMALAGMLGLSPELGALLGLVSAVVQVVVAMDISEAGRAAGKADRSTQRHGRRIRSIRSDAQDPLPPEAAPVEKTHSTQDLVQAHDTFLAALRRMRIRQEEVRVLRDGAQGPEERAHAAGWMAAMQELAATIVEEDRVASSITSADVRG